MLTVVVDSEHTASTGKTGLDLVGNEEAVVLLAKLLTGGQVAVVGADNTGLTLGCEKGAELC